MIKFNEDQVMRLMEQGKDKEAMKTLKKMAIYSRDSRHFWDYVISKNMMIYLHDKQKQYVESLVVLMDIGGYYSVDEWNENVDVCVGQLKNYLFKRKLTRW